MGNEVIFDPWRDEDSWPNEEADSARIANGHRRAVARRRLGISERELEVIKLVAQGFTNVEIGRTLFLSAQTIQSHLKNIMPKLTAKTRAHVVAQAYREGLLP